MRTPITEHFTLEELTRSDVAIRLGIDNTPTEPHRKNLLLLCENVLEPVRCHFGPVRINSGYRSMALNMSINPMTTTLTRLSRHCVGQAADFEVDGVANADLAQWIIDHIPTFHQVILEFYTPGQPNSGWVHCSFVPDNQKKEVLTATSVSGTISYLSGLHR